MYIMNGAFLFSFVTTLHSNCYACRTVIDSNLATLIYGQIIFVWIVHMWLVYLLLEDTFYSDKVFSIS